MLIAFDLDGTLVDSRRDLADAANALLADYGVAPLPEHDIGRMVGEGARVLVSRVLSARGVTASEEEALARFLRLYDERLLNHTRPYDGVEPALERCAAYGRLAVLTNKPGDATNRVLEGLGLRAYFDWVVPGDGALPRKPDPEGLRWLAANAAAGMSRTALVGDSRIDVLTARAAGAHAIVARYGFGFESLNDGTLNGSELVVERAVDVPAAVEQIAGRHP